MLTFFHPSPLKLKILLGLVLYLLACTFFIASFNSPRNIHPLQVSPVERIVTLATLPSYILGLPVILGIPATIADALISDMEPTVLPSPDTPKGPSIQSARTIVAGVASVLIELAGLYFLACICSLIYQAVTKRN